MGPRSWIALGLVAAIAGVYYQVAGHAFVGLDDYAYTIRNSGLRDGLSLGAVTNAFRPYYANWIPLTALSFQIDFALYGLDPAGYHLTNLAQHTVASLLLFFALDRLTGDFGRSAFVAALFAVHPLHVESVAWVSERKDTLSGMLWMLTLLAYARYIERPGWSRYLMVLAGLSLGLLAKPMLVTLPFVLLLLDFWPVLALSASGTGAVDTALVRRALVEKVPMLALAAATAAVALAVQETAGAVTDFEALPLGSRITNAIVSYAVYVRQTLWPTSLAAFYPLNPEALEAWRVSASALALLLVTAGALRARRTRPYLAVGWLWFVGTLVPVIGIVQVGAQAHADRYMYIPLVGLAICGAWGGADLARYFGMPQRVLGGIALAILFLSAIVAWRQVGVWRDTETLYLHTLSVTEGNYLAHGALGGELLLQSRVDAAEAHFAEAARIHPTWPSGAVGLADVAMARGHIAEALQRYEAILRAHPDNYSTAGRYGLALGLVGRAREARVQLARALTKIDGVPELHRGMAEIEASLGNLRASVRHGRAALRLMPDYIDATNNLAWTLATCHDPDLREPAEAIRLIEAPALESGDASLLDTLAAAYAAAGRYEEAIAAASRAAAASRESDAAGRIRARIALFRQGLPYVEPAAQRVDTFGPR